jgi:hypothetical protein
MARHKLKARDSAFWLLPEIFEHVLLYIKILPGQCSGENTPRCTGAFHH